MAFDITSYALSKKYVDDTANALGAVKGAPCTIKQIDHVDGGQNVVFEWTAADGTSQTQTMFVPNGTASIDAVQVDDTLSQAGQAADAKAVGDSVRELSEEIKELPDHIAQDVVDVLSKIDVEGDFIQIEPKEGTKLNVVSTFSGYKYEGGSWIHPYMSVQQVTSKNLVDFVSAYGGAGKSQTVNGVTATINADSTYTLDGLATAETFLFSGNLVEPYANYIYPPGTYTISKYMRLQLISISGDKNYGNKIGGAFTIDAPFRIKYAAIYLRAGDEVDNETLPLVMVRGNALPDSDFEYNGKVYSVQVYKKTDSGTFDWNTGVLTDADGNVLETVAADRLPEIVAMPGMNTLMAAGGTIKVTGEKAGIGASASSAEEAFDPNVWGLPVLKLDGDTGRMTKDLSVDLTYRYGSLSGTCSVKWQGSSSLAYLKKNYTIKFDNAFEAKDGWGVQKKYCLKANYIDHSHARNIVNAKLWGQIVKSRNTVPTVFANLINGGAVDGFPVLLMINDKFKGLYTFNIPKDGWQFGMGGGTNEAIVSGQNACPANGFKEPATLTNDFEIEYVSDEANAGWVKTSLNNLIQACIASDGSDLDTTLAGMIDWQSVIDYYIFAVLIEGADITQKNALYVTFDGTKWYMSAYDMDCTYGLYYDGSKWLPAENDPTFASYANVHRLMELIKTHKADAVKARYAQLRETVLSESNIATTFANFIGQIPKPVFMQEAKTWPMIPNTSTNDISQIRDYYRMRVALADKWIEAL